MVLFFLINVLNLFIFIKIVKKTAFFFKNFDKQFLYSESFKSDKLQSQCEFVTRNFSYAKEIVIVISKQKIENFIKI